MVALKIYSSNLEGTVGGEGEIIYKEIYLFYLVYLNHALQSNFAGQIL